MDPGSLQRPSPISCSVDEPLCIVVNQIMLLHLFYQLQSLGTTYYLEKKASNLPFFHASFFGDRLDLTHRPRAMALALTY